MLGYLGMLSEVQKLENELRRTQRDMEVLKRELRLLRDGKAEQEPRYVDVSQECEVRFVLHGGATRSYKTFTIWHKDQPVDARYRVRFQRFPKAPGSVEDPGFMWTEAMVVERMVEE